MSSSHSAPAQGERKTHLSILIRHPRHCQLTLPRDRRQQTREPDGPLRDVLEPAPCIRSSSTVALERSLKLFGQFPEKRVENPCPDEDAVGCVGQLARFVEEGAEGGGERGWRGGEGAAGGEGEEFVGEGWGEKRRGEAV